MEVTDWPPFLDTVSTLLGCPSILNSGGDPTWVYSWLKTLSGTWLVEEDEREGDPRPSVAAKQWAKLREAEGWHPFHEPPAGYPSPVVLRTLLYIGVLRGELGQLDHLTDRTVRPARHFALDPLPASDEPVLVGGEVQFSGAIVHRFPPPGQLIEVPLTLLLGQDDSLLTTVGLYFYPRARSKDAMRLWVSYEGPIQWTKSDIRHGVYWREYWISPTERGVAAANRHGPHLPLPASNGAPNTGLVDVAMVATAPDRPTSWRWSKSHQLPTGAPLATLQGRAAQLAALVGELTFDLSAEMSRGTDAITRGTHGRPSEPLALASGFSRHLASRRVLERFSSLRTTLRELPR